MSDSINALGINVRIFLIFSLSLMVYCFFQLLILSLTTILVPPHEILLLPTNRALVFNTTKQKQSHTNSRLEVREAERITLACNTSTLSKPPTLLKWFRNGIQINKGIHHFSSFQLFFIFQPLFLLQTHF
jgi:hypothetical protein